MATTDTLCAWNAQALIPAATNYATQDTRNAHPVADYDATTEETGYFEDVLPVNYSGGGLTVDVYWMASTATTGDVIWGGSVEQQINGGTDQDADSFATEQTSAAVTTSGTSGVINKSTITHTSGANMDSMAAGDPFRYRVARKAAAGGDTMAGDAELLRVVVRET